MWAARTHARPRVAILSPPPPATASHMLCSCNSHAAAKPIPSSGLSMGRDNIEARVSFCIGPAKRRTRGPSRVPSRRHRLVSPPRRRRRRELERRHVISLIRKLRETHETASISDFSSSNYRLLLLPLRTKSQNPNSLPPPPKKKIALAAPRILRLHHRPRRQIRYKIRTRGSIFWLVVSIWFLPLIEF